jgi:hypothetical protein
MKFANPTIEIEYIRLSDLAAKFLQGNAKRHDLDSFLGSGSTLIACETKNRRCFGLELDEKYASAIVERWETFTGRSASRLG